MANNPDFGYVKNQMARFKGAKMKRILLATVAIAALASASALAADMPPAYKAAPMMAPAPVATWTGCYVGGNIGGAFGNASASTTGGEVSGDGSGFAGGGQVGCDYEFGGGFVIGARELFDWTSNSKSGTFATTAFGGLAATADFEKSMVRHPDGPHWLCSATQLVALLSGRRRLGSYNYKRNRHFWWYSIWWPDLQHQKRLDDWWRR